MSAATESQRPDDALDELREVLETIREFESPCQEVVLGFSSAKAISEYADASAARLTALERERDELRKAANEAIGWLTAMLERREYDADHELRDLQDMLARAALTSSRETTDG